MSKKNPVCEHCGHEFDPQKTVKGPVICPACGLTAHPFGVPAPARSSSATSREHRFQPIIIAVLVLLCVVFASALFFNLVLLQRINIIQGDQARIFAMLAELQVDSQPVAAASAEQDMPEDGMANSASSLDIEEPTPQEREMSRLYRQLEARLQRNYPLLSANAEVKLRQQNGQILRGTYVGMKDDAVLLLQNGQIRDIKAVLLDRESRLRIDPVFRDKVIRLQIKRTELEQGER